MFVWHPLHNFASLGHFQCFLSAALMLFFRQNRSNRTVRLVILDKNEWWREPVAFRNTWLSNFWKTFTGTTCYLCVFTTERFHDMKRCPGTCFTIVMEDVDRLQIVGAATLFVERKFIYNATSVSWVVLVFFYTAVSYWSKSE